MAVKLSPFFNGNQFKSDGSFNSGGTITWYVNGTTSTVAAYKDYLGNNVHTNPIVLNSEGMPPNPIFLSTGVSYTAVVKDAAGNVLKQVDNIEGINDVSSTEPSEWIPYVGAITYFSISTFTTTGDTTQVFTVGRRIKYTLSTGVFYGTVSSRFFSVGVTTIIVAVDTTPFDASLTTVEYSFLNPAFPSFGGASVLPSGTRMPFYMTVPPAGWIPVTTQNDAMMVVVDTATSGGLYSVNGNHSPTFNNLVPTHTHTLSLTSDSGGAHSHSITDPGHYHAYPGRTASNAWNGGSGSLYEPQTGNTLVTDTKTTGITINSGGAHTHTFTGTVSNSGTTWAPRYNDFIIGEKS